MKREFVCDTPCVPSQEYKWKLGKKFATALTGFVAGALAATMMLYPWLRFLGDYCPNPQQNSVTAPNDAADRASDSSAPVAPPEGAPAAPDAAPAPTPSPTGTNLEVGGTVQ